MNRPSRRRAFTIVELLLALFLTALLTSALSMMIGQAARDRRAMLKPDVEPAWMVSVTDHLERDLHTARWWAGTDDRLVLIGLGRDGRPAHIEYRWREEEHQTALLRQEQPLTWEVRGEQKGSEQLLTLNASGVAVGPYRYGEPMQDYAPTDPPTAQATEASGGPGVSILVAGKRVPLRALPDQVEVIVSAAFAERSPRTVSRKVVLR